MKKINVEEIKENAFSLIGKDWMLVTSKRDDGKINTMTASWGGVGILWGAPVAFVFVRSTRYTKEFIDESGVISLSFFEEEYRDKLAYCGKISGRDEDKVSVCGFSVENGEYAPYFKEAKLVLEGEVLYQQDLKPELFRDGGKVDERWYPLKDYHTVYVMAIRNALEA